MAVIGTRSFKGEVPKQEPYLLSDEHAQHSVNCYFSNGSLKSLYGNGSPLFLTKGTTNPIKGLYTNDGIGFYTWNTETQTYKGPVVGDSFKRLYYLQLSVGQFRVATEDGLISGPVTPTGVKAGVPRPNVPAILAAVDRTTIPGYEGATLSTTCEAWWEDGTGRSFSRAAVTLATSTPYKVYAFTKPALPTELVNNKTVTIEEGLLTLCAKITCKVTSGTDSVQTGSEVYSATMKGLTPGRSSALPGGIEFTLEYGAGTSANAIIRQRWGIAETRAYVYTVQNQWDEEGAPSPAETISVTYLQDVKINAYIPDLSDYYAYKAVKVYRTYGTNATYIESGAVDSGAITNGRLFYDRTWKPKSGGKALESNDWTPPPTGLQGSALMANGWFAAFKDNTLYMSEPYRPHAWPYSMTFTKAIRGIKAAQQSLVVTTADGVAIVTGSHPKAVQQIKLSTPQAGIAQRSMANIDGAVAYLSHDGIVLVEGSNATTEVGQKLFDRRTWRDRFNSGLVNPTVYGHILEYYDGCLIGIPMASYGDGVKGFMIRFDEGSGSFTRLDMTVDAMVQLPVNDALYYTKNGQIYQFNVGSELQFDWWSKDYILPQHVTFGAGFARFSGSLSVKIYADGVEVYSGPVASGHFRLPALNKALRWSYRLTGTGTVNEFMLGRSMAELQNA